MNIHVDITATEGQAATVELLQGDTAHVMQPPLIIAYQGAPQGREDRILNLSGMYRKKRWVESRIAGPARFVLGLPMGFQFKPLELMTGHGKVLLQPTPRNKAFADGLRQDSLLRRVLREALPFGGVFIK